MIFRETYSQNLKKRYEIEIPASTIDDGFNRAIESRIKNGNYPGFRKGKVPFDFVVRREPDLIDSVIVDEVYKAWYNVKEDNKILIFNNNESISDIESSQYKDKKENVKFHVECELLPDVPDIDFTQMKLMSKSFSVSKDDVELEKKKLEESLFSWEEYPGPIKDGDKVKLDLEGSINGKPFRGGTLKDFECVVGEGKLIASLNDALIGLNLSDSKVLSVDFPADYHDAELAGKNADFATVVKSVWEKNKPSDPEKVLMEKMNCKTPEELEEKITSIVTQQCEQVLNASMKEQVEKELEKYDFLLPESLIQEQKSNLQNENPEIENVEDESLKKARLSLMLVKFASNKDIKLEKSEVAQHLLAVAASSGLDPNYLVSIYSNNRSFANSISLKLMENKIFREILSAVQKDYEESSVPEILRSNKE